MTHPHGSRSVPERHPSGVTAILAGFLALALAGVLGYLPVKVFIDYGIDDLPGGTQIVLAIYLGAALILLTGALVTFFRAVSGAVLLIIGALAAVGAVVAEPLLLYPGFFAPFFKAMFEFGPDDAFVRVGAVAGGLVVLVLSVLPPTFRYLRHRSGEYPAVPRNDPERSPPPRGW